ncbi:MAG: B12-binding domain-containing radical SAM protein [Desulfomonilia bacterium]|jgi:anaerobic magnesium-protoporphyrin IX monomethyl ester cyclase|uniref:Coproporphyrinogen III oxidase n=1 Tax=anaerobic digester metagenome TaxID=1263854 RepID=A0A485M9I6_9ZZZZ|nr:radical SAM protein [Pseudomonadota bacterium]HON37191.1 radical SAM protein [Deltaproteobacteria bacterium]HRS54977.1 radical SAM protein [Desulfomonilia bacterium]HPD20051.1 radical SAM protein [Deltaproteobacteria bacterium]HPX18611.1 radical SAM protein [Deltaproteobacteria bacterium]
MSEVALVYPYVYRSAPDAMLFYPLGIAQLAMLLRDRGVDVVVADLTFQGLDHAMDELEASRPRIIGMYVAITMMDNARKLAGMIRERLPGAVLVCGGPMPTVNPERFVPGFDIVFRGEAVQSFPRFCVDYLKSGRLEDVLSMRSRYPGISFLENGALVQVPVRPSRKKELDRLPVPALRDFDHAGYQQFWKERSGYSPACIMTTYGCPYDCDFCSKPIFGRYYRPRSMEAVFREITVIRSQGYDGLWVADDCFTLDIDHVRRFCRMLIREDLQMAWTCLSRAEPVPASDIELMKQAGCRRVYFGLESGCDDVLRLMNKHTTTEKAALTVQRFSEKGIQTAGFFMIGYPGETYETIETTLEWALSLPLDDISFTIPVPLPGTRLFERVHGVRTDLDWRYENENRMIYSSEFDEHYLRRRISETQERFSARRSQYGRG